MSSDFWKVTKADDHQLDIVDPNGWFEAAVKWDGCIHFYRYFNVPLDQRKGGKNPQFGDVDYLHICDIDNLIERLQSLKEEALKHFGGEENWPR